ARARGIDHPRVLRRVPARLPDRVVQPRDGPVARPVGGGGGPVPPALPVPRRGHLADRTPRRAVLLAHARRVRRRGGGQRRVRRRPARRRGGPGPQSRRPLGSRSPRRGGRRNTDAGGRQPLTGGASKINIYGAIEGQNVFRINALTGDPNHLGIELAAALVLMLPIYLRLERGHRYRTPLAVLLGFLFVVELATLSRSGMLGLG